MSSILISSVLIKVLLSQAKAKAHVSHVPQQVAFSGAFAAWAGESAALEMLCIGMTTLSNLKTRVTAERLRSGCRTWFVTTQAWQMLVFSILRVPYITTTFEHTPQIVEHYSNHAFFSSSERASNVPVSIDAQSMASLLAANLALQCRPMAARGPSCFEGLAE